MSETSRKWKLGGILGLPAGSVGWYDCPVPGTTNQQIQAKITSYAHRRGVKVKVTHFMAVSRHREVKELFRIEIIGGKHGTH